MDALLIVDLPSTETSRTNCTLGDPQCLGNSWILKWALQAATLANSTLFVPNLPKYSQKSGDTILDLVRTGAADITPAYYVPRTDRLYNLSVLSAATTYFKTAFLVNPKILGYRQDIMWSHIFTLEIWIIFIIWLIIRWIYELENRSTYLWLWMGVQILIFESVFKFFCTEFNIQNSLKTFTWPFETLREAYGYTLTHPKSSIVEDRTHPEILPNSFGHRTITNTSAEVVRLVLENDHYFTYADSEYLIGLKEQSQNKLWLFPSQEPVQYTVTFSRKGLNLERLNLGYMFLNEMGHTYVVDFRWVDKHLKASDYKQRSPDSPSVSLGQWVKFFRLCVYFIVVCICIVLLECVSAKSRKNPKICGK